MRDVKIVLNCKFRNNDFVNKKGIEVFFFNCGMDIKSV